MYFFSRRHRDIIHKDHAEDLWRPWEVFHMGGEGQADGEEGD